jgi:hypothetical protein
MAYARAHGAAVRKLHTLVRGQSVVCFNFYSLYRRAISTYMNINTARGQPKITLHAGLRQSRAFRATAIRVIVATVAAIQTLAVVNRGDAATINIYTEPYTDACGGDYVAFWANTDDESGWLWVTSDPDCLSIEYADRQTVAGCFYMPYVQQVTLTAFIVGGSLEKKVDCLTRFTCAATDCYGDTTRSSGPTGGVFTYCWGCYPFWWCAEDVAAGYPWTCAHTSEPTPSPVKQLDAEGCATDTREASWSPMWLLDSGRLEECENVVVQEIYVGPSDSEFLFTVFNDKFSLAVSHTSGPPDAGTVTTTSFGVPNECSWPSTKK